MGFSGLFTIEAILKMVGYGLRGYFKNGWNQFDFAIVLLSDVDAVFLAFPESDLGEIGVSNPHPAVHVIPSINPESGILGRTEQNASIDPDCVLCASSAPLLQVRRIGCSE